MVADDPTIRFYADNAALYAGYAKTPNTARLDAFLAALPAAASILELGCGNGRDSALMLERGFLVTPTDGSAAMALEAEKRLGIPVAVLEFSDLAAHAAYEGIWANACLLHVARDQLADVLARIHRALRPGGLFYASYKAGEVDGRDDLGRYYNYPSPAFLRAAYETRPWSRIEIGSHRGGAYDGKPTEWLHVTAQKA